MYSSRRGTGLLGPEESYDDLRMAQLRALSGDSFSLTPTRYQFDDLGSLWSDGDANWLMIRLDADIRGSAWSAVDPALQTWSLTSLAGWVEGLAAGTLPAGDYWLPDEACLYMEVGAGDTEPRELIVKFAHEFRPRRKGNGRAFRVRLAVETDALQRFASELRAEFTNFPIRHVGPPDSERR